MGACRCSQQVKHYGAYSVGHMGRSWMSQTHQVIICRTFLSKFWKSNKTFVFIIANFITELCTCNTDARGISRASYCSLNLSSYLTSWEREHVGYQVETWGETGQSFAVLWVNEEVSTSHSKFFNFDFIWKTGTYMASSIVWQAQKSFSCFFYWLFSLF